MTMLKDKPIQYLPARATTKRQRTWIISILATLILLYYLAFSTSNSKTDIHPLHGTNLNWHRYAYSQYATDQHYLCNSVMVFDSLHKLGSKADRLLFYPKSWDLEVSSSKDRISQLLVMARDKYKVKLKPTDMYTLRGTDDEYGDATYDASINKLHAFRQDQYDRIIHLDSDITLLQHLDDLFFLPSATVAMPRAYWKLDEHEPKGGVQELSSLVMVLQPSDAEATQLWDLAATLDNSTTTTSSSPSNPPTNLATTLLTTLHSTHSLVLPHRPLLLLTSEFRRPSPKNHTTYLSNTHELWSPHTALSEAKIIHFSDHPVPKPWILTPNSLLMELRPGCEFGTGTPEEKGCDDRMVWMGVYDEFRRRRKEVCRLLSVPAPEWPVRRRPKGQGVGKGEG